METKLLNADSGWLKHFTLGTTDINPNRDANSYKYWNIPAFVSGRLDDKAKTYYLYIKASKTTETGEFILSENKIDIEQEVGFYHFLYATVNSEYEGERGIAKLNGFTEITGGQIKTDKITSGNGEQYIHLFDDHIEIKANLKITDGNKTEIKQLVNPDLLSLESRLKSSINNIQVGGRNLLKNSGKRITNNNYNIAIYELTENINEGEAVTLTIKGKLGTGKTVFAAYNSGDFLELSQLFDKGNGIYQNTFNWRKVINGRTADNKTLWIWTYNSYITTESTIEWIKLEKGNRFTEWTPAPGDLESQITTAKTATEAYARTQAELTKTQAIANADGKITAAEQRQIQQLQQKLQEAKTFAEQKVNDLNVGGRNLLYNSKQRITNSYYNIATYRLTEELKVGELLTITIKGQLGTGKIAFALYDQLGNVEQCALYDRGKGIYQNTFNYKGYRNGDKMILSIWTYDGSVSTESTIEWIKLEKGNKPTDWSPAPEDVWDTMVDLGIIDKNAAAINEAEKANIKYINGVFSKGADYTNGTETIKNTITTGALTVGNVSGGNAGINGAGLDRKSIRIFAGKPYSQKEQAPFRVDDNGELWATNAHISGQVNATSGQIGQFYINTDKNDNKGQLFSGDNNTGGNAINYSGVFLKNLVEQTEIHLSSSPIITQNGKGFLDINYKGDGHNTIGSNITVRPHTDNEFQKHSLAQKIDGNIFTIGQRAIFDDGYIGLAESYAIINNIRHTHTFIFTSVASNMHAIYLPNHSQIIQITGKSNVTFELVIVMSIHVEGRSVRIQGVDGGALLDNNGNWHAGNNYGYMDMGKGDVLKLRYYNGHYYITGHDY